MIYGLKLLGLALVWWVLAFFGWGMEETFLLLESLGNIKPSWV